MADPRAVGGGTGDGPSRKEIVRLVVALIFAALFIAFIVDNSQSVRVGFVFFNAETPLIWVLVVTALLGALIAQLVSARGRRRRRTSSD